MRGLFVTGTGTGVGKSVLAAAICAALVARGERVAAFKPALTGLDEPPGPGEPRFGARPDQRSGLRPPFPRDHELLAAAAGGRQSPAEVAPYRYGPALSPHLAAELAGEPIDPEVLLAAARAGAADADVLVCEGVGGLLVPLAGAYLVRDLAVALGLPMLVAARPGLGTINHTLLTVEAGRTAGLRIAGIVMTPWPELPEPIAISNRQTVETLTGLPVSGLPPTEPAGLTVAGAALPLDDWV